MDDGVIKVRRRRMTVLGGTVMVAALALLGMTFAPSSASADPVIAAAGDIACDPLNPSFNGGSGSTNSCHERAVSDLMVNAGLSAVLPLGDNQYYCGGYNAFVNSYANSWGRLRSITRPAVGNHEYITDASSSSYGGTDCNSNNAGAKGYFDYFNGVGVANGPAGERGKGYYSYDVGSWHLIALNSQCSSAGGCSSSTPQGQWLAADLAANANKCKLAYWHIPLFSSGGRANQNTLSFWNQLYAAKADIVLAGHDHTYERFAPQRPDGTADATNGIRQFIVGTGGANHTSFVSTEPNSQVRNSDTYGVLKLTLHASSYEWQFVPEPGKTFTDSGSGTCHTSGGEPPPPPPPPPPGPVTKTFVPVADSYVDSSSPLSNYGGQTRIYTDASPVLRSYVRFNLTGLGATIDSAKLRINTRVANSLGFEVRGVTDNTWGESTITSSNAPAVGSVTGTSGGFKKNKWVEVNVKPLVQANGLLSVALTSPSSSVTAYGSREAGSIAPQLVVTSH